MLRQFAAADVAYELLGEVMVFAAGSDRFHESVQSGIRVQLFHLFHLFSSEAWSPPRGEPRHDMSWLMNLRL